MATNQRHKGVSLIKPDPMGRHGWRARWVDPDNPVKLVNGKRRTNYVKVTLPEGLNARGRERWAIKKAKELRDRKRDLEDRRATRKQGIKVKEGVRLYYEAHPKLRSKTLVTYRDGTNAFITFCEDHGIQTLDDLQPKHLALFRSQRVNIRKPDGELRSELSVNRDLRSTKSCLRYLVNQMGAIPFVTANDITVKLALQTPPRKPPEFLGTADLKLLFAAVEKHDGATHKITRAEHRGKQPVGTTPKYQQPMGPLAALLLLTGMRLAEAVHLEWSQVDLDAKNDDGKAVGEIHLDTRTKTKHARTVDLGVTPRARDLLVKLADKHGTKGRVLPWITYYETQNAQRRMRDDYGAPEKFSWQKLRATCGTFLTCSPGIFGAASAFLSAKQLGHSVTVAERHYAGRVRGISPDARTLEAAMGVEVEIDAIISRLG